jgi:hypothetical protein
VAVGGTCSKDDEAEKAYQNQAFAIMFHLSIKLVDLYFLHKMTEWAGRQ